MADGMIMAGERSHALSQAMGTLMPQTIDLTQPQNRVAEHRLSGRERITALRQRYAELDTADLEFEMLAVSENIGRLKADIVAEDLGQTRRGAEWRANAERAHNLLRLEEKVINTELRLREEQAKHEKFLQQRQFEAEAAVRKAERLKQAEEHNDSFLQAFVREAKATLQQKTYERIFNAALTKVS